MIEGIEDGLDEELKQTRAKSYFDESKTICQKPSNEWTEEKISLQAVKFHVVSKLAKLHEKTQMSKLSEDNLQKDLTAKRSLELEKEEEKKEVVAKKRGWLDFSS